MSTYRVVLLVSTPETLAEVATWDWFDGFDADTETVEVESIAAVNR